MPNPTSIHHIAVLFNFQHANTCFGDRKKKTWTLRKENAQMFHRNIKRKKERKKKRKASLGCDASPSLFQTGVEWVAIIRSVYKKTPAAPVMHARSFIGGEKWKERWDLPCQKGPYCCASREPFFSSQQHLIHKVWGRGEGRGGGQRQGRSCLTSTCALWVRDRKRANLTGWSSVLTPRQTQKAVPSSLSDIYEEL